MIKIRKANLADAETLIQFQIAMAQESENLNLEYDTISQGVRAVFIDPSKGTYFVAEQDGILLGTLMITLEWSDWRNSYVIWIQSVYVLPAHRRLGIYRKLYEYVKDMVTQDPQYIGIRLYVDQRNLPAQKVYHALGMESHHYYTFEWMSR